MKYLKQQQLSQKLMNKYKGTFQIEVVVRDYSLAYQIQLLLGLRIYPTFPITSLEPYREYLGKRLMSLLNTVLQAEPLYKVETILSYEGKGKK